MLPLRHVSPRLLNLLACSVGGVMALLVTGCTPAPEPVRTVRPVQVLVVGQADQEGSDTHSGEVRSRMETALAFRVGGKLQERLVQLGDRVQAGQILARLETQDTQLATQAAEAQATLAANELRRYQELRAKNFVSQAALDGKEAAATAARAQADLVGRQRDYTVLKADQSGVVAAVQAEVGQVVTVGQPIFRVAREDQLEVAIQVSEQAVAKIKKGMQAKVSLWSDRTQVLLGAVREVAAVAELPARTYAVRVSIPANPALHLGQSAQVRFEGVTGKTLQLPASAIFQQGQEAAVWVVKSGVEGAQGGVATVHLRPVKVAAWSESGVTVLEGVTAGDMLVKAGVHKLTEGETVRAVQP